MTTLQARPTAHAPAVPARRRAVRRGHHTEIFLVSFAALLIEICYTRVISYKLFYYYTYLVIGLALLGIGTGAVLVAVSKRLRRAQTDTVLVWSFLFGGVAVVVTYVVGAFISLDSLSIWNYANGGAAAKSMGMLVVLCLLVFVPFVAPGVIISTLFGRRPEGVGGLYFADLVGAGLACAVVVYLTATIGPPATIMLAGAVLFLGAGIVWWRAQRFAVPIAALLVAGMVVLVVTPDLLPAQRLDTSKSVIMKGSPIYSAWSPIFRVDAFQSGPDVRTLYHDGIVGSAIYRWDGKVADLAHYDFNASPLSIPFAVLGTPPRSEADIGAAGGHEVLASLWFKASHVDAVELNPVTYNLVTTRFADFDGHLAQDPQVTYLSGDGRSYMARSDGSYNLIWYPAPDSYSATNAATASAFVLSESYLYTTNALVTDLQHLSANGIFVAQFGEVDYQSRPYRTTRFVATARQALTQLGVSDPGAHILVATSPSSFLGGSFTLSTIVVKRSDFSAGEVSRFVSSLGAVPGSKLAFAPGYAVPSSPVDTVASASPAALKSFYASYKYNIVPTTDNDPFFWHFTRFGTVFTDFFRSLNNGDREDQAGERVLVLLLALSVIISALFLLVPFLAVRKTWRRLPRKGRSAVFFGAVGVGFMFFEITLMQLLNLFLGYPTYALTVALMAILVFTGVGALLSQRRFAAHRLSAVVLLGIVAALTVFYLFGLTPLTDSLLDLPLGVRVPIAIAVLAPLGVCLGMFMPIGLRAVSRLTDAPREYVAWGWAINGFASVVGATLATLLSMTYGFHVVLALGLGAYVLAVLAWWTLSRGAPAAASS